VAPGAPAPRGRVIPRRHLGRERFTEIGCCPVLRDILDFRGQKCTFEPQEREGFLMGEPYKITIRHTPGASQPWSYKVVKGGTQLDSGVGVSRREAIDRAERFAD